MTAFALMFALVAIMAVLFAATALSATTPCSNPKCGSRLRIRWSAVSLGGRLLQPDERDRALALCLRCGAMTEQG